MNNIHINQLGYRPYEPKKAVIPQEALEFSIIRASDETVVFNSSASEPVESQDSKEVVRIADFSSFTIEGEYIICAKNARSYPFKISKNPYKELRASLLEMFNYQKCGADLDCGLWSHPACHTSPALIYGTNEKKDVSGGWHDAGDYGRYIVPAGKTAADLLLAHELSPNPDSSLLETVWFEIEWMLKMQDEKTGGVHHKVSCKHFNALEEMPDCEHGELVITPVSSTATANFAAVMALASRFYPEKKSMLLKAAARAWDWLRANPDLVFENPGDIHTGPYGDDVDKDERFWAACELFRALKDETFHDYIKKEANSKYVYADNPWAPPGRRLLSGLGWGNMGTYGVLAYLMNSKEKKDKADALQSDLIQRMKEEILADCAKIMGSYKKNPYGISLGEFFPWGSNMVVGNNAMMLIIGGLYAAEDSTKKAEYTEAAREHLHYLLGRNPLSQCYVTGFGSNPVKNPHHRPSAAKGKAVPGMVAGGPCSNFDRDPAVNECCADAPPSKRYVDRKESFSTNEIAIYWNSPAYFVTAVLGY